MLKKLLIVTVLLLSVYGIAFAQKDIYKTYTNERYGYKIDVPSSFIEGEAPSNDDGRKFTSPDGRGLLLVYAGANIKNQTPDSIYQEIKRDRKGAMRSRLITKTSVDAIWDSGNSTVYRKTLITNENLYTFILSYPKNEKIRYESITRNLRQSFTPPSDKSE